MNPSTISTYQESWNLIPRKKDDAVNHHMQMVHMIDSIVYFLKCNPNYTNQLNLAEWQIRRNYHMDEIKFLNFEKVYPYAIL